MTEINDSPNQKPKLVQVQSKKEVAGQQETYWASEFIADEIRYFREMVDYLRSIERINDEQAQRERGKIEGWEERSKRQLEEGMDYEIVRARLRKTGNALTQRFVCANVREFTKKTGVAIPFEIYDGKFFITESPDNAERIAKFIRDPDTKVRKIRSWGAALGNEGVRKIADALKDPNCKVTELALENDDSASSAHRGQITTQGALDIAEALSVPSSKIRSLSFAHNRIGEEGAIAIARAIQLPHSQVQELNLLHNFLGDECSHGIAEAIRHSNLRVLNLWMCSFGVDGIREIASAIETPGNKLRSLHMGMEFVERRPDETPLSQEESEASSRAYDERKRQGIKTFLDAVHNPNAMIEKAGLENERVGEESIPDIVSLIRDPRSRVRRLSLHWNEIGDQGAKEIIAALSDPNTRIREIILTASHNMTARGKRALSQFQGERPDIKTYF